MCPELKRYLHDASMLHAAIGHKWLGVGAGEGQAQSGEAVGFLLWAKRGLEDLGASGGRRVAVAAAKWGRGRNHGHKPRAEQELESVAAFLVHYQKMNDSVSIPFLS